MNNVDDPFDEPIDPVGDVTVDAVGMTAATTRELPIIPGPASTTKAVRKEVRR